MPSTSTSMSAQRCLSAWKLPIGRPNCTRSFAYSTVMSSTRAGAAEHLGRREHRAAVDAARRPPSAPPSRSAGGAVEVEPAELTGAVHRRLGGGPARRRRDRPRNSARAVGRLGGDHDGDGRRRRVHRRVGPAGERPGAAGLPARSRRPGRALHATAPMASPAEQPLDGVGSRRRRRARRSRGRSARTGTGRGVAADLLEQHRELDGAEARGRRAPRRARRRATLLAPSRSRCSSLRRRRRRRRRARTALGRRHAVEQLAGPVAQRDLIFGQVEVHTARRLAAYRPSAPDARVAAPIGCA